MKHDTDSTIAALNAIKQASRAAKHGDLAAAERWTKNAERLAEAVVRTAGVQAPVMSAAEEESLRAELRARLVKFVECDLEIQAWEAERDAHAEAVGQAMVTGGPMPPPLRPCPAGPEDLERIAIGKDWNR